MTELTHAEQVVFDHVQLCNNHLCVGHRPEKDFLFNFKIGDLVTSINARPRNLIGAVHGFIYSPFTNSYRVVLDVDCDVEIDNIRRQLRDWRDRINLVPIPENVIALDRADAFILQKPQSKSKFTVPAAPVLSNTAVSCGNGKLFIDGSAPELAAQPVAAQD
jgi:hypothetical protein